MFRESKNCKQTECLLTSLRPGRTTQHGRQSQHDCLRLIVVSFGETALCVSPVITYKNFPFCRSILSQSRNSGRRFMMNLSGCAWFEKGVTWHVLQVQEEKSTFISGKYPPWSQTNWVRVNISFSPSRTSGQKKYLWKWYKLRAILCMDPGNGKNERMFGLTLPLVSRGCWSGPAHQRFSHREVLLDSQSSPWSWKTDLDILWQIVV